MTRILLLATSLRSNLDRLIHELEIAYIFNPVFYPYLHSNDNSYFQLVYAYLIFILILGHFNPNRDAEAEGRTGRK